jgi:peptidoglycan LD-endopeptidase CwlK
MMRRYRFSRQSLENLRGVHPGLVAVVVSALYRHAEIDFTVLEGVRSEERQRQLVLEGSSWTMESLHLVQPDGWAHAVDLAPYVRGSIPWDDWSAFAALSRAMKAAAGELGIDLLWGGHWKMKDGPHFELGKGAGHGI